MFYKSATNDVVKGFDLVHTKYYAETDDIELWLGEAKFYANGHSAAKAALASIIAHLERNFLQQEKALIGPLLPKDTPGYHKLAWMFNDSVPLDEIVNRLVIPTLVTFDSDHVKNFCGDYQQYVKEIEAEIVNFNDAFGALANVPIELKVIYLPLGDKDSLCNDFVRRLEAFQ
jgi:hypothetical protein